jgi:hypothetical protein
MDNVCRLCSEETKTVYNIKFKAVPICDDCGRSIFLQQANWYAKQEIENNKKKKK